MSPESTEPSSDDTEAVDTPPGPIGSIGVADLTKYYDDKLVLDQISLSVAPGEAVVLIGASGSGKSTLLRCVSRLVEFDHGTVTIGGDDLGALSERELRKRCGMVFQSYNLFPTMTVMDNITLAPRRVHGVSRHDAEQRATELLRRFGLDDYADAYPERLSGGQQQRVAVVRAMATRPDVLLLDEITAALDPELIGGVLEVIADLKNDGITMLIVTHEMGFARDVADVVCFMDEGQLVESGPPADLLSDPQHPRTRQFLQRIIAAGRL